MVWHLAAEHVKQTGPEAENVGLNACPFGVLGLFGADVVDGSQALPGLSQHRALGFAGEASQAHVEDLHDGEVAHFPVQDENVRRFDVPMGQPTLMSMLQAKGRLPNALARPVDGQPAEFFDPFLEIAACGVFHHQEVSVADLIGIKSGDNVWMLQGSHSPNLAVESRNGFCLLVDVFRHNL